MDHRKEESTESDRHIKSASREVSNEFQTLINADDIASLHRLQYLILGRLQDSNAVLTHFNEYSENCFAEISPDFLKSTGLLRNMKADLDYVFMKLRSMKARLLATYPDAFSNDSASKILDQRPDLEKPI